MATEGALDDIKISDIAMHDVTTPLHLSIKEGNLAGRIWIDRLSATGAYLAAASLESWAKAPIGRVCLRDVSLEFSGGGKLDPTRSEVRAPGVDARPLPAWGLYARNLESLELQNVRLSVARDDARPAIIAEHVGTLDLDGLRLPAEAPVPMVLRDVHAVRSPFRNVTLVDAHCVDLSVTLSPPTVVATVAGGEHAGLAQVELNVDDQKYTQWVWVQPRERKLVSFMDLPISGAGAHHIGCGPLVRELSRSTGR